MCVALFTPGDNLPSTPLFPQKDKVIHFLIFGMLTFLWSRVGTLDARKKLKKLNFFTNYLVFGIILAILLEYLQKYVPNRSFDLWDIAANIIGGTIGVICFYILYKRDSKLV
ncbi:hypothetical protein P872_25305 [Rhodonellum psychrophilum GCM71 = DSM 17998]|jgi:VanZ family protein|uniref:VanZ-like domain-containing protein n=2 Tax=Rhodonellum TaxID=336827 RepID=U5C8G1_9BACT|nr:MULTISPECIES: VanZ family protein [Rhodonellum]ERM84477.1 hypothetical protein P872_25305 [Rhodonellum psychrophilum GCM71 = DSM 17998]SDZ01014.1 VanZ like family protein [Rhodonellum ikkaensis]